MVLHDTQVINFGKRGWRLLQILKEQKIPNISEPLKVHLLHMQMFTCLSGNLKACSEETDIEFHVMYKEVCSE